MKTSITLFFTLFALLYSAGYAQVVGNMPGKGLDIQTSPGGFVTQLPPAKPEAKGDVYLNSDWTLADITLVNAQTVLSGHFVRVDLSTNDLEINVKDQIKVLVGAKVQSFVLNDASRGRIKYINGQDYSFDGVKTTGFLRVIEDGEWKLVEKTSLKLVKANYVASLDAGVREDRLVKEKIYFLAKEGKLYEVHPSIKKFANQFGEKADDLVKYIKENKLNLKQEDDLKRLLEFFT
jgi:hypothetical protein